MSEETTPVATPQEDGQTPSPETTPEATAEPTAEATPEATPEATGAPKKKRRRGDGGQGFTPATRSERRLGILNRTIKEVRNYTVAKKVSTAVLACVTILTTIIYIASVLYTKTGSFTVNVDKFDMTEYGLSLSETRDLSIKKPELAAGINDFMTNISSGDIPADVDHIDGEHNGENYIAYTFYLVNAGQTPVKFNYQINISEVKNDLDSALRIRLYVNGEDTTYAKTASNGSGAEPGTTEFFTSDIVTRGVVDNFDLGETIKYTIVIWIEGNDPDCVDRLIGGRAKLSMGFSVDGKASGII
ncbi:MAG: hypothetical protein IKC72_04585 [Clostridia bacterium]|nr:hypothetical protein [Clostridia bacterium]